MATATRPDESRWQRWHGKFIVEERYVRPATRRNLYLNSSILIPLGIVFFIIVLTSVLQQTGLAELDRPAELGINSLRSPSTTAVMAVITTIFGPIFLPIIILVATVTWALLARHLWRPLLLAGAMVTGVIVANSIAPLVHRHRPPANLMLIGSDATSSFPSGHVLGASDFLIIAAFLLISRAPSPGRVVAGAIVAVLGIVAALTSRMYLGYHWLTDILASLSLSMVIVGTVIAIDTWRTVRVPDEPVTGPASQPQRDGT
ncbi:phosphatase PAP2 family protein [Lacisediminihabitans sp.]|jgi:undecaprenyl-diphosphatase|uniref:phosphatase PAP2 family protein n=1 Tax=Lacisediminihabitans sp. TaxID=2787631 RepID=UPI002F938F1D